MKIVAALILLLGILLGNHFLSAKRDVTGTVEDSVESKMSSTKQVSEFPL